MNVTAVLGPTNTGKTHLAVERMLAHGGGMIGLPLRLLAREIYDRVRQRAGDANVALITGEEKIIPASPRYWVSTVEAMPDDVTVPFLAIDEVQLCADFERGHIFTDRVLNRRGREETMLLGAATMRPILEKLLPGTSFVSRPRFSRLTYSGQKKITRLPGRSAIVASAAERRWCWAHSVRAPATRKSPSTSPATSTISWRPTPLAWVSTWMSTMLPLHRPASSTDSSIGS
jgi:ATP-dependent RNA helicase SUPV3L1/SUV3